MFSFINLSTVKSGFLTKGWFTKQISFKYLLSLPTTIFSTMLAGFPSSNASSVNSFLFCSITSSEINDWSKYLGLIAATCIAISLANSGVPSSRTTNVTILPPICL